MLGLRQFVITKTIQKNISSHLINRFCYPSSLCKCLCNVKLLWSLKRSVTRIRCDFISFFQMKLLNTTPKTDNFSAIIITTGLGCHHKDLFIYGQQDAEETDGGNVDLHLENLHFVGTFSKFQLVEAEIINGFNRCVFKPVVNGFSPYVFVALKGFPETENWKICEVEFA